MNEEARTGELAGVFAVAAGPRIRQHRPVAAAVAGDVAALLPVRGGA